jgi:opacity protein-like surface antigen
MRSILCAAALVALTALPVQARTILFIGNSFTYGQYASAKRYQTSTVTDLNGPDANGRTFGGVPAIFKTFTREAGLDYQVSLETVGGKGFDFHYTQKLPLLDKAWDDVVMQGFSTLDADHPGDPGITVRYTKLFADTFSARNRAVKIYISPPWSRADLTYPAGKPWSGKPIEQMALDVEAGFEAAAKAEPRVTAIVPVGLAFNRAIAAGFATPNPYAGLSGYQVDLWAFDKYHASDYGYYLEALLVFGRVTGRDPLSLGDQEKVADDFGFLPVQAHALQQIAHDQLAAK